MSLWTRLIGTDPNSPRLNVHAFIAALGEYERGKCTRQAVINMFGLSAAEQTDLDTILPKVIALPESYSIGCFVNIANIGAGYDAISASKGLGFVAVDVTGVTRLEIRIRYNKIGTGTLTWQLWNDTDLTELGTFVDAAAAGDNKTATIVVTPASPLNGGVKQIRPRVQSTAATDDPVYYGACLFLRRVERMTAEDLHEVLLLAGGGYAYATEAALKARLRIA